MYGDDPKYQDVTEWARTALRLRDDQEQHD